MRTAENGTSEQNTENVRPVYTRKLPHGRTFAGAGAAPGAYLPDGEFIPWEELGASVTPSGTLRGIGNTHLKRGAVLVLPEGILSVGYFGTGSVQWDAVILPDSLKVLESEAFGYSAPEYIRIPPSLISAGSGAFAFAGIGTAVLPEHASVGERPFLSCSRLVSACTPCPGGENQFEGCPRLSAVHISDGRQFRLSPSGVSPHTVCVTYGGRGGRPELCTV